MYEIDNRMSVASNDIWKPTASNTKKRRARPPRRAIWLALLLIILLGMAFPFLWHKWVDYYYGRSLYTIDTAPSARVAVVFGARVYGADRLSGMLRDRVETAIRLYEAGKVQKILVSGDNQTMEYNEPGAMMAYAIRRGVPPEDIQPDYGGRRTYDTCYRAHEIFQLDEAILVTQEFHLPRAVFLCRALGVQAVGVIADLNEYHPRSLAWSEMREIPAVLVALLDVLMRRPPPIMGAPIPIG